MDSSFIDCQVSLSIRFPRQEYWSGLPFPSLGDHADPGIKLTSSALAGGFTTTEPLRKPQLLVQLLVSESESHSVMSDSLQLHGLYSPWNYPGQNTGVCSHSLLQRIFLIQGSNPCLLHLLHWQADSLPLGPPGNTKLHWGCSTESRLEMGDV